VCAHARCGAVDVSGMLAVLAATLPFFAIGFVGGIVGSFRGTMTVLVLVVVVLAIPVAAGYDDGAVGVCDGGRCAAAWLVPVVLLVAFVVPYLSGLGLRYRLEHTAAP